MMTENITALLSPFLRESVKTGQPGEYALVRIDKPLRRRFSRGCSLPAPTPAHFFAQAKRTPPRTLRPGKKKGAKRRNRTEKGLISGKNTLLYRFT